MKSTLCKICALANRQSAATGQAFGKVMANYAKPTPVCDKCGAEHEARKGKVEWKAKQRKLIG